MNINLPITTEQISIASVALTVGTFLMVFLYCKSKKIDISLQELILRSISASALPTSLVLLACAIDITLLTKLGGFLQVYIAVAGLSLAYISLGSVFASLTKPVKKS